MLSAAGRDGYTGAMAARLTRQPMAGAIDGSVILRGIKIDLDSDIGNGFVVDCCRHIEDLAGAEQLKARYQLTEEAWRQLADNEPLQQAIARTKEGRIRSGEAAKEKAQHLFLTAPTVLSNIVNDSTAPARSRIEAARELRQTAAIGSEDATPIAERFSIRIDLTADGRKSDHDVIVIEGPAKKVGSDVELEPGNDADTPLLALIAANKSRDGGDGEPI
jgi:hypothetical protein